MSLTSDAVREPGLVLEPVWAARRARLAVAIAALGTLIAGYLTWVHLSGALALCTGAGGCEQVQASRYSSVAGVPVALLGLGLYLGLLGLTGWRARGGAATPDFVRLAAFGVALAGVLYSAYLTYLELFVIYALCPWCVSSAVLLLTLCGLVSWDLLAPGSDPVEA